MLPVQIVGSTLTLTATGTSLPANGASPVTLTITAQDAGGFPISGADVTLTQTGAGAVTLTPISPATGKTGSNGKLTVSVAGATAGVVAVSATGVGAQATINFTVAPTASTFGVSLLTLNAGVGVVPASPKNTSMKIGDSLLVQVTAPSPTTDVTFATTIGTWNGTGNKVVTVPVTAGVAAATLSSTVAGVAGVQVLDPLNTSLNDTLSVGITAKIPASITLQATPTVIPQSVGTTVGYSNLTAVVYDATGAPVGGAPVSFEIVSGTGTGAGETVSPVVVYTASTTATGLALGAAPTTFTAGSLPSNASGVQVRASVVGTAITTQPIGVANATNSSFDIAVHIGGQAGSVAFGQASHIIDAAGTTTFYQFPMSVLVADATGNPAPLGTPVSISAWPIAWSTGQPCSWDPDGYVWSATTVDPVTGKPGMYVVGKGGTFLNEDANENLNLDASPPEDGTRKYYYTGATVTGGTKDGAITPVNSWGGTVVSTNPADKTGTVTTDANGVAAFNLTYTKTSAYFVITRIRAQTQVQGTPAVGQINIRLPASEPDSNPVCRLPPSPFTF